MIKKTGVLMMIAVSIVIFTSCGNVDNGDVQGEGLERLTTPTRLSVATPEAADLSQVLGPLGMEIGELQGRLPGLSEEEKTELEEKKEQFYELSQEISKHTLLIEDEAAINELFRKIEAAQVLSTVKVSGHDREGLEYYNIAAHYEGEMVNPGVPIEEHNGTLEEGYLYHFSICDDDTLWIWDEEDDHFLEMHFEFRWFQEQMVQ